MFVSTMDGIQKIDFDDCWIDIEKTITALLLGNSISSKAWNDRMLYPLTVCLLLGKISYGDVFRFSFRIS